MIRGAIESDKAPYSWWWGSHISPNQSQWLQATLTDLDEKTKAMLSLIQEDGDSFTQRAEMYYKKRPELIKMVEEFHRSFRSLAERYDQLRSESTRITQSGSSSSSSSSNSFKHLQSVSKRSLGSLGDSKHETRYSHPESIVEDPDIECNTSKYDYVYMNKSIKVEVEDNQSEGKFGVALKKINGGEFAMGSLERETMWSDMRLEVLKLMEDNLRQQAELIRRNDEKREAIKDLCLQLDKVMDENKNLQNCLRFSKVGMKQNSSQISKLKGMILGKFLGGGSQ